MHLSRRLNFKTNRRCKLLKKFKFVKSVLISFLQLLIRSVIVTFKIHTFELGVLEQAQLRQAKAAQQQSRQSPDLIQNPTMLISSVEMTPPEDDTTRTAGYLLCQEIVKQNEGRDEDVEAMSSSSSVFMSPWGPRWRITERLFRSWNVYLIVKFFFIFSTNIFLFCAIGPLSIKLYPPFPSKY